MSKNLLLINESDLKKLVTEATKRLLSGINTQPTNDTVFHFTTMDAAYSMMKDNRALLSHASENSSDFKISNNHFFYMSFTRDGKITTSQYPLQMNTLNSTKMNVRFSFSLNKLNADGFNTEQVSYMKQRADSAFTSPKPQAQWDFFKKLGFEKGDLEGDELRNALEKFAETKDTKETRLLTNKHILENLNKYVNYVDILLDLNYIKKTKYQDIVSTFSHLTDWNDKIRFFGNVQDFDNGINYKTVTDLSDNIEQELSQLEIDFLKKTESPTINTKSFIIAANAIYVMAYTNRGINKIKLQAKRLIEYASLDNYVVFYKKTEKEPPVKVNFMNQILDMLDDVDKHTKSMDPKAQLDLANAAFFNAKNTFKGSRLISIGIAAMYTRWLGAYKSSVMHKYFQIYNELKSIKTHNDVIEFAKRNTLVFREIFSGLFTNNTTDKRVFKDFVDTKMASVNEGRKSTSQIKTNSIMDFVNSICHIIFDEGNKDKLLNAFKQQYNEFYQLSELKYFKRSVMMFKNRTISSVRKDMEKLGDIRKFGDLATLYNNADKANDENGL